MASAADIEVGADAVRRVFVAPAVLAYIVDIARATRISPSLSLGQPAWRDGCCRRGRAWAWLNGRDLRHPRR